MPKAIVAALVLGTGNDFIRAFILVTLVSQWRRPGFPMAIF